ncbi:MAG: hypothetical protein NVS3B10_28130 [Polyangiales bacterium]
MIGRMPVAVDESFRDALVELARAQRWPSVAEPARLAPQVAALAAAYNDPALRGLSGVDHRAARLGFWLPRDVPKMAGAVREAVATGHVAFDGARSLRVLDVGAGLGASHRGLARALDAAGARGVVDVLALDADAAALELAGKLARARPREGSVELRVSIERREAGAGVPGKEPFDVILLGQVLTELDLALEADARVQAHRARIAALLERLSPRGVLVVVEPALRPRARHLQRVRGALLDAGDARVFAPCLHEGRCPLLGREGDWCHEDLDVDLPPWLVPVAKLAGLRWEGLTFSYLVLTRRGASLRESLGARRPGHETGRVVRAVSHAMPTKGKVEVLACGDPLRTAVVDDDPLGPFGARLGRLDRERSEANDAIGALRRGDVLDVRGTLDDKGRVHRDGEIELLGGVP